MPQLTLQEMLNDIMVLRINMKTGTVIPLDNALEHRSLELTTLVKERIAMLKAAEVGDVVPGIGVRYDNDEFVVHET